ncbi:Hypothetical predicted protein [Olea europaea subsp. europaea]|uniref:Uncharacterized protein n=1 Tax=Olea europaea subsp. europaea TaxID=158383 RepID=A0A8S0R230_OLEEU|nr:Hypothetical predicted protein [Olea europaea subsp. europaea]
MGTVCSKLLIKSLLRGWGRKVELAKFNDCDRMSYTVYEFPLAIQLWVHEAIPELGARFSNKLHLWALLRPTTEEELQPYFANLLQLDVVVVILDNLVVQSTKI